MGKSTFCWWGSQARDAAKAKESHARCKGLNQGQPCDCPCHGNPTEPPAVADEVVPDTTPAGRRRWTETQKRLVIEEYLAAPVGHKSAVLRHHKVSSGMVARWANQYEYQLNGRGGARPNSGPARVEYIPPTAEQVERLEQEILMADTTTIDETVDDDEADIISIELVADDRDVLEALAFLARVDNAAVYAAQLIGDAIEVNRTAVADLIRLRHERQA